MSAASTKKMHDRRRAEGICIQNKNHGPAHKGGRCLSCWIKKLAIDAKEYRDRTGCDLTYVPRDSGAIVEPAHRFGNILAPVPTFSSSTQPKS